MNSSTLTKILGKLDEINISLNIIVDEIHSINTVNTPPTNGCTTENVEPNEENTYKEAMYIKHSVIHWRSTLNERKLAFWNYFKHSNTADIYSSWITNNQINPVMPRKFRPKDINGENQEDKKIRQENAVRNFESEIKIIRNKANRQDHKAKEIDDRIIADINNSTNNQEVIHILITQWTKETKKEEEKSGQIWLGKQKWLEEYGAKYQNVSTCRNPKRINKPSTGTKNARPQIRNRTSTYSHPQTNNGPSMDTHPQTSNGKSPITQTQHQNQTSNSKPEIPKRKDNLDTNTINHDMPRTHPLIRNGTTYIGKKVKTPSFLDQHPYNRKGGGNGDKTTIRQTRSMTSNLKQQELSQK